MSSVRVNITGLGAKFENEQKAFLSILADTQVEAMAKETESVIKQKIKDSIQRPGSTGNLANNFYAEKISDRAWGIGNIAVLNTNAKYWKWLNYGVAGTGRRIPPSSMGSFSPLAIAPDAGLFREGRFVQDGSFPMTPTKAIEPHNYIEKTLSEIPNIIRLVLSRK